MRALDVFPLPGGTYTRSSGYGSRVDPISGRNSNFHGGVDYAAAAGTPIFAPWAGTVRTGFEAGGAGNWSWVTADNGDLFKAFHLSRYEVRSGPVASGQVIGYVGTTGASTGAHLHAELWQGGTRIDPTGFLAAAPLKGQAPAPAPAPADNALAGIAAWAKATVLAIQPNHGVGQGAKGDTVKAIQFLLCGKGHQCVCDGDFGPGTKAAVAAYQSNLRSFFHDNSIVSDGIVGPVTAYFLAA